MPLMLICSIRMYIYVCIVCVGVVLPIGTYTQATIFTCADMFDLLYVIIYLEYTFPIIIMHWPPYSTGRGFDMTSPDRQSSTSPKTVTSKS